MRRSGRGGSSDGGAAPRLPARYRAVRRLGAGGAADVFVVEDAGSEPRLKALKVLRGGGASAFAAGFREEFRMLACLEHPGLARVYDFGELPDGRAFYTAEI